MKEARDWWYERLRGLVGSLELGSVTWLDSQLWLLWSFSFPVCELGRMVPLGGVVRGQQMK